MFYLKIGLSGGFLIPLHSNNYFLEYLMAKRKILKVIEFGPESREKNDICMLTMN